MPDRTLRWPKIMPSWCYRDPATIGDGKPAAPDVPRETLTPAQPRVRRDRHYTQAARLKIQSLMKGIRIWRN